jgi:GAF domain-containing protein
VIPTATEKQRIYDLCLKQVEETLAGENDSTAVLASVVCILKQNLPYAYWVGFYRLDPSIPGELVIGPYQGTFGCLRIPVGKGVCGTCAQIRRTVIVPNVHDFEGHIACDAAA